MLPLVAAVSASCGVDSDPPETEDVSALLAVCTSGTSVPSAPAYVPSSKAVHPIRLFQGPATDLVDTSDSLASDLTLPQRTDLVELVACSTRIEVELVNVCTGYGKIRTGGPLAGGRQETENKVELYTASYDVEIREVKTGKVVGETKRIHAFDVACPLTFEFASDYEVGKYYATNTAAIDEYLRPLVIQSRL